MHRQLGDTGLIRNPSHSKASRARFAAELTQLKEVKAATTGNMHTGGPEYLAFIQ